jgi:hypothetical protein
VQRAGRELDEAAGRQRHVAEAALDIVQLERARPRDHEIGLVGHRMHMGAARLLAVRCRPLIVDREMGEADACNQVRVHHVTAER